MCKLSNAIKVSILSKYDLRHLEYQLAVRINKHRKLLIKLFEKELARKEHLISENNDLSVGEHVLLKFDRPVGTSKLFQTWKGIYKIKKILDNDAYLVSHVDDDRKDYVVFRPRLKKFGPRLNNSSDQKLLEEGKSLDKSKNNKTDNSKNENHANSDHSYKLRSKNQIDYRPYF